MPNAAAYASAIASAFGSGPSGRSACAANTPNRNDERNNAPVLRAWMSSRRTKYPSQSAQRCKAGCLDGIRYYDPTRKAPIDGHVYLSLPRPHVAFGYVGNLHFQLIHQPPASRRHALSLDDTLGSAAHERLEVPDLGQREVLRRRFGQHRRSQRMLAGSL